MRNVTAFSLPLKTKNPSNGSFGLSAGAAMARASERKKQRRSARIFTIKHLGFPKARWRVTITRVSPGKLDAHDNLRSALKSVADGIADALGVDDGGGLVDWQYLQRKGGPGEYSVDVLVEVLP